MKAGSGVPKITGFFFIAILALTGSAFAHGEELVSKFTTRYGDVALVVSFDGGKRDWAEYAAEKTRAYVAAMELWTNSPFRSPRTIRVEGSEEVWFDTPAGGKKRIGGANDGYIVRVEYGYSKIGDPRLIHHELGHYWFGYSFASDPSESFWLIEGIASVSADAMSDSGFLSMTDGEKASAMNAWGGPDYDLLAWDYPLERDRRYTPPLSKEPEDAGFSIFYDKSYKAVYYMIRMGGLPAFGKFCERAIVERTFSRGNQGVLSLLGNTAPSVNWKKTLSGWVFPGTYQGPSPKDFSDVDSDGILGLDEILSGTDPLKADTDGDLLPDGYEKYKALNPRVKDNQAFAEKAAAVDGPWADGDSREWSFIHAPTWRSGNTAEKQPSFSECRITLKNGFLFALVKTSGILPRSDDTFVDLMADTDGDGNPDREFAAVTSRPDIPWIYAAKEKTSIHDARLDIGIGDAVEFKVPLEGLPGVFRVLPILRNSKLNANIAEWGAWITFDPKIASGYDAYSLSGDPRIDDTDRDGIPDGDEILLGLDPTKADSQVVIARYGPFIDGNSIDWKAMPHAVVKDGAGDAKANDLVSVKWKIKGGTLSVFAELAAPPTNSRDIIFDILVDRNGDNNHEIEFAFTTADPSAAWYYLPLEKKSVATPLVRGGAGSGFEISIPMDLVKPVPGTRIYPIVFNTKTGTVIDALDSGWITLEP